MTERPADSVAEPLLVSAPEAARLLGISPRLLWTLTRDGDVPSIHIGRRVLYSPDALRGWIAEKSESEQ